MIATVAQTICRYTFEFKVCKVTDIINAIGRETVLHSASFPDHSILTWQIKIGLTMQCGGLPVHSENTEIQNESFVKYDIRNIPHDFMSDNDFVQNLHETVFKLGSDAYSQNDLVLWSNRKWQKKFSCKTVKMQSSSKNKKRKIGKPWWNDNLTNAWNEMCTHEKNW